MIEKMTCRNWFETTYKGIWDERTMNDVKLVDEWRRYLMQDSKPSDWMTPEQLSQYGEFMKRRMNGE